MVTDTEAARLRQMLAANWATKEAEALSALPRLLAQRDELLDALEDALRVTADPTTIFLPSWKRAREKAAAAWHKARGDAS